MISLDIHVIDFDAFQAHTAHTGQRIISPTAVGVVWWHGVTREYRHWLPFQTSTSVHSIWNDGVRFMVDRPIDWLMGVGE